MFTLNRDDGVHLLALGNAAEIVLATATACLAIAALVAGVGGWLLRPATWLERALLLPAAGLLLYTGPVQDALGLALLLAAVAIHVARVRRPTALRPST